METIISLMIVIIVFMSLLVATAYVADGLACEIVKWLKMYMPNVEE